VPEGFLEDRRIPRVAFHTLRRVPLISSRTASLRPLPSCRCCLLPSPGPSRPKPGSSSPVAEATSSKPCARAGRSPIQRQHRRRPKPSVASRVHVGRNRRRRGASTPAETVVGAYRSSWPKPHRTPGVPSGRSLWFRSWPSLAEAIDGWVRLPPRRSANWSGLRGNRGCRPSSEEPGRPPPAEAGSGDHIHRSGVEIRRVGALPW
jgi:hypothetical protein